jgi:type II secretory pathway pseudopilin PulG
MPTGDARNSAAPMASFSRGVQMGRRAFTLAESLIASVVLATAVTGLLTLLSSAASQAVAVQQDTTALSLARELMEMTSAVSFAKPVPDTKGWPEVPRNTNCLTYDDILDFNGYTDTVTSTESNPTGGTAGDGRAYLRTVTVTQNAWSGTTPADFMRVTVTVTPPKGRAVTLHRLVTKADPTRQGE